MPICQNGTMQSPIDLPDGEYSQHYRPTFSYSDAAFGDLINYGYGAQANFNNTNGVDVTGNPSMTFGNETVYLLQWVCIVKALTAYVFSNNEL